MTVQALASVHFSRNAKYLNRRKTQHRCRVIQIIMCCGCWVALRLARLHASADACTSSDTPRGTMHNMHTAEEWAIWVRHVAAVKDQSPQNCSSAERKLLLKCCYFTPQPHDAHTHPQIKTTTITIEACKVRGAGSSGHSLRKGHHNTGTPCDMAAAVICLQL